jgi:hypothetical protein
VVKLHNAKEFQNFKEVSDRISVEFTPFVIFGASPQDITQRCVSTGSLEIDCMS